MPASPKEMLENKIDTENCKKLEKMRENCLKLAEQNQKLIEENNEQKEGYETQTLSKTELMNPF